MLASLQRQLDNRPNIALFIRQLTLDGFWDDLPILEAEKMILACPALQELACPARLLPNTEDLPSLISVVITINERECFEESQEGMNRFLGSRACLSRLRIAFVGEGPRVHQDDEQQHKGYSFAMSKRQLSVENLELSHWWTGWLALIHPADLIQALARQPRSLSLLYCEFDESHWSALAEAASGIRILRINTGLDFWCDSSWPGHAHFPKFKLLRKFTQLERLEARSVDVKEEMEIHGPAPEHIREVVIT
jgi:hypothetical protein